MTAKKYALIIFIALLIALGFLWSRRTQPALAVRMLNVGLGESVLVREPSGKKILFDGGPNDSVLSELGSILPAWDSTIDLLILSHDHSDHITGFIPVLDRYAVKEIWTSGTTYTSAEYTSFLNQLARHDLKQTTVYFDPLAMCQKQSPCPPIHTFGTSLLQVYHPLHNALGEQPKDPHDDTVVVKISYKKTSILLTGDLNEDHEKAIVRSCLAPNCTLHATIMQVPHHGSATGLNRDFLQAINPSLALIPVGLNNKFGHPAPSTLSKLGQARILTYRTDTQGQIHALLWGESWQVNAAKP